MKKLIALMLTLLMIISLAACGNNTAKETASSSAPTAQATEAQKETAAKTSADGVDIDLTAMSATMVYSEVQNMMLKPADYLGKTVKMAGAFNVAEENNQRYYACVIKDATACCAQGIEFVWEGDHAYPDDYPAQGDEISVIGTFTTYKEKAQTYCQLKDAQLTF